MSLCLLKKTNLNLLRENDSFLAKLFYPTNLYHIRGTKSFHYFKPIYKV